MRKLLLLATAATAWIAALASLPAQAASDKVVIGDIDDMSGLYADVIGPKAVEAIKMAIADFGGSALGKPIEIKTYDHQNKPDLGAQKFREFADRDGVTMVLGGSNTGVSLAMSGGRQGKEDPVHRHRRRRRLADRQGLQRPIRSTTPMTRPRSATARRRRSSSRAARAGSSSPPTTPSARNCSNRRSASSRPAAATVVGAGARAARHLRFLLLPPAGAELPARRCSASPTPAAISSIR